MPLRLTVPPAKATSDSNGDVTLDFIPVKPGRVWVGTVQVIAGTPGEIVGAFVGPVRWGSWNANVSSAPLQAFESEQLQIQGSSFPPGTEISAVWIGADYDMQREQYPILAPTQTYSPYVQISAGTVTVVQPTGTNLHAVIDNTVSVTGAVTVGGTVTANQGGAPWSVSVSNTVSVTGAVTVGGTVTANQGSAGATPWPVNQSGHPYAHIANSATHTIKSGAGTLRRVVVGTGGSGWTATVYDSTTGSGTVIAVIDASAAADRSFDAAFSTGLTVVTAGATPGDLTVIYD